MRPSLAILFGMSSSSWSEGFKPSIFIPNCKSCFPSVNISQLSHSLTLGSIVASLSPVSSALNTAVTSSQLWPSSMWPPAQCQQLHQTDKSTDIGPPTPTLAGLRQIPSRAKEFCKVTTMQQIGVTHFTILCMHSTNSWF